MGKLTVLGAKSVKAGRHADGDGLYLLVKPSGARSWMLRVQQDGKRRDVGLGSFDPLAKRSADDPNGEVPILHRRVLTLVEAREKAAILRKLTHAGRNPIEERDKDRKPIPTFEAAARACQTDLKAGWADKNAAAFLKSLEDHAFPLIGRMRVDLVEATHVRDVLAPIWLEIPEQARKVQHRLGTVLSYAKLKGWRLSDGPGKAAVIGLARRPQGGNFASMPYADVPDLVADLEGKSQTVGRLALLFLIHTAARSGEVRNARWSQIDRDKKLWNRPADIMKGKVAHTVTLTDAALAVLDRAAVLRVEAGDPLVFPSTTGKTLSDNTLSKILRDAQLAFTVHGFRSSFRDFAAEQMPTIPDPVAEAALAHVVPDKVERAYKRTNFLEMRRTLLDGWSNYLAGRSNMLRLAVSNG